MSDDFDFGSIDVSGMKREVKRVNETGKPGTNKQSQFSDMFVAMPEGKGSVVLRILPPSKGGLLVCRTRIHKINGKNFHCPQTLNDQDRWEGNCPVCGYYRWLYKEVDRLEAEGNSREANKRRAEARALKANERFYFNVMVRIHDENMQIIKSEGPKIFSCGIKLYSKILRAFTGDAEYNEAPLGDITDWKTGRDLQVIKELQSDGSKVFPNYERSKFNDPSPLGTKEQIIDWMGKLYDLSSLRKVTEVDELDRQLAIYRGLIPDAAEDTGYNPDAHASKYVTKPVVETVVSEVKTSSKVEEAPFTEAEAGEAIDIDEFYKQLRQSEPDDE